MTTLTAATPFWWRFASPPNAYRLAGQLWPAFALAAVP